MNTAIVAFVQKHSMLGQSIGCIVPLRGKMRINRLVRVCDRIVDHRPYDRVSINVLGAHGDVEGRCLSVAFHLLPTSLPIPPELFERKMRVLREWVRREFGVKETQEREFPSRIEFCDYLRTPLSVM